MLYPYKFAPLLFERPWGGNALARFGKLLPPGKLIGESWEISDRHDAQSVVANGPLKGKTLRQLIQTIGAGAVVGRVPLPGAPFPLLIKLLDARQRLSLQVHPPAAIAGKLHGEPKTEMWYVLDAEPDAHLIAGLRRGASGANFIRALEGRQSNIEDLLHRFRVLPGDVFFVPSGRLHAIDAGLVLVEIQQNSDTTYRVHDWGRVGLDGQPRKLHVEESLASIDFHDFEPGKAQPVAENRDGNGLWRLVECEHFHVQKLDVRNAWQQCCDGASFHILGCVAGELAIITPDGREERLVPGEFALLPAALGYYTLAPQAENTAALRTFLPQSR
jgi:mannose-6-phosphate isomerase